MLLEEILSPFSQCKHQQLDDKTVFQEIKAEEFYFAPPLVLDDRYSNIDNKPCRFILFSSPGAVGKTALAKYVAKKYNGYYWNVAQKTINGTSFMGELAHAIGIGRSSLQDVFISALESGETLVVLDSFDEAELISHWDGVEALINEIGNIISNPQLPSIILTARTEMADRLCLLCEENGFGIKRYNIDYFEINQAGDFIKSYLKFNEIKVDDKGQKAIDAYLEKIRRKIEESYESYDTKEFVGYAQVLKILSVQIEKIVSGDGDLEQELSVKSKEISKFIYDVIQGLIIREKSKLDIFKQTICKKYGPDIRKKIQSLYSKEEQLTRLNFFILCDGDTNKILLDDYGNYDGIYEEDKQEYLRLLKDWLPQHVFLKNNNIMPVFSDYLFAESLIRPELSLFKSEYEQCRKLPTRVFMDCYLQLNNGCVNSADIYFVDSAYLSQVSGENKFFCEIGYADPDNLSELYLSYTDLKGIQTSENKLSIKINWRQDDPIRLNRVENMSVNVKGKIELTSGVTPDVLVRQSSIECDDIDFAAKEIIFETYGKEENVIIAHNSVTRNHDCKIRFRGTKDLKADLPTANHPEIKKIMHEFEGHFYSFEGNALVDESVDDIVAFAYGLKKVLEQFKVDKYEGDPAKLKDKVTARCKTGLNKRVLDFLLKEKAIYEDKHLYKYNREVMNKLKINRAVYTHFDKEAHQLQLKQTYERYKQWLGINK